MAVHLADRPPDPRPLDLPVRRVDRPLALATRVQPGRRRAQVHRVLELPAAPLRPGALAFPRRPQVAIAAGLGDRHRDGHPRGHRLDARGAGRPDRAVRAGPAPHRRRHAGRVVWLLVQALVSEGGRPGRSRTLRARRIAPSTGSAWLALLAVQQVPWRRSSIVFPPIGDHAGRHRLHVPDDTDNLRGP